MITIPNSKSVRCLICKNKTSKCCYSCKDLTNPADVKIGFCNNTGKDGTCFIDFHNKMYGIKNE